ncbi:putative protein of unknown function DUF1740 [Diplodia seriata]|uniref:Protein NRDE2-like protein n=1 Tax=Diplodia seriata TaxID=420778 RepID=A0A0G2G8H2_9PEZI|nr:putative protein of unknown function DUF1740 [Diplodia seriata]
MLPPQAAKPTVPKFSSFKPKQPPPAPPKDPSPNPDDDRHRRRDRHEDRERDHWSSHSHRDRHSRSSRDDRDHRHRDRDHRDHRDRDHRDHRDREKRRKHRHETDPRHRQASEERRDDRAVAKQPVNEDVIYVIDRKGDLANLQYGRLHQYSVPSYFRAGCGSVLGLPSDAKIDRFASDDRTIIIDMRRRRGGSERQLMSKRTFGKEAPIMRVIKPTEADAAGDLDSGQDFIPVRSLKRKRHSESPEPQAEKVDYRSIEGKAKASNQPDDSDLEYASDGVDAGSHADFFSETKERNALLTRKVQDDPRDLQAWLDLVEHQESMLRIGSSDTHRQLKSSELHALASLRFDIYQRASKVVQSERLIAGLMEESSKIHQREEHFNRWKQVLSENHESTTLWMKYLDALQTNLAEFHFENCRSKFLECLKIISKSTTKEFQQLRVYIFLRLTSLMKHAGYHERAVALWQALLEIQLFRPPYEDNTPSSTVLQDFEEFWESECPRFGEHGAVGWATAKQDGEFPDPPESTVQDDEEQISLRRLHRISSIGDAKPEPEARTADADDDTFHPATILKVRNTLIEGRDHSISVGDTMLAVHYAECLALFTYILEGRNIEAALGAFLEFSSILQSRGLLHSAANEAAHQSQCQLLSHHSKRAKLFKPAVARSALHESIALFPNNTKFLAAFAANEARFRVDDRVRAIVHDVVLKQQHQQQSKSDRQSSSPPSIVGWQFAVFAELKRGANLGGSTHAVRAAFEKATASESVGCKSAALWESYVDYLVGVDGGGGGGGGAPAAKRAFLRGLRFLPYAKRYLMRAFAGGVVEAMGWEELRSVYRTLLEKELRVHVDIEEEVEEVGR